ncbi:MAG: terpene cyclase/mutase family protein [Planctomycetes bacterium]|nr:terpene cyclase/mutase family protein [Planctomycetota bacterium]MBI3836248.1 terpene cyclase/mutase family protein [Planctomycetota bacterium]
MRSKTRLIPSALQIAVGCALAAAVDPSAAESQAPVQTERATIPVSADNELSSATMVAVDKGLAWLAQNQSPDGSYGMLSHYGSHVGITGLAGLAFLADGNTPGRGRYAHQVDRILDFVLSQSSESGLLAAETSHGPMYGHGFATLFLAEIDGMSPRPEVREALRRATRLIANTQNEEGGWRYQPVRADADISVTVCEMMALRAARNVGVYVDKNVIDHAVEYVKASQNPDGGFRYMLNSGGSAFARSAGAVASLQYAGLYNADEVIRGLEYIGRFVPPQEQVVGHYFYGHYYAAQAMFLAGDKYWQRWWPQTRAELLEKQEPEGFWRGQAGDEYGTAMALVILQIPNRLLPIFQK